MYTDRAKNIRKEDSLDFSPVELVAFKSSLELNYQEQVNNFLNKEHFLIISQKLRFFSLVLTLYANNDMVFQILRAFILDDKDCKEEWEKDIKKTLQLHPSISDLNRAGMDRTKIVMAALNLSLKENFKVVFKDILEREVEIQIYLEGFANLIKYKHYKDIVNTFGKNIGQRTLNIFFDMPTTLDTKVFKQFNLAFYCDQMILLKYKNAEILSFIH
jgi:hypothetical protein